MADHDLAELVDVELRPAPGVLTQELDGELVILHPVTREFYVVSPGGTATWRALEAEPRLSVACAFIAARFGVAVEQVADDVQPFLDQMIAAGLLIAHPVVAEG